MSDLTVPIHEHDHAQGNPHAPVTLLEYGDYECPHCGRAHRIVKKLVADLSDELRFVFRNFPLSQIHPHALHAAVAAEAAGLQGKFWEMHDMLFENQDRLDDVHLLANARAVGLDIHRFAQDFESPMLADRVRDDFMSGVRSGVNGTPTFFINGRRYDGPNDYESLLSALSRKVAI